MIRVMVSGCLGRMGSLVVRTLLEQEDMLLAGGYDPASTGEELVVEDAPVAPLFQDLSEALEKGRPDCLVDFTILEAATANIAAALDAGIDCVVGTSGLSLARLRQLASGAPQGCTLFVAPNFTLGAVLLMRFAAEAARYFSDVEVIEFHHNHKADAPSGTAIATAERMAEARRSAGIVSLAPGAATELAGYAGARGALVGAIPVHAVRSDAFMASQQVIFGAPGQKLLLQHDSSDRAAYMPGVMLAIRKAGELSGLVIGLEALLD
jgi:4-hydroxy-tetrahydrodipicolinate reductase